MLLSLFKPSLLDINPRINMSYPELDVSVFRMSDCYHLAQERLAAPGIPKHEITFRNRRETEEVHPSRNIVNSQHLIR